MLPTTPPHLSLKQNPPFPMRSTWLIIFVFCLFAGLIAETFVTPST